MRRLCIVGISIVWLLTCCLCVAAYGDTPTKKMRTTVLTEGSIPPVRGIFTCVHELEDKPFSDAQIKDCVAKLAAFNFIHDVKVNVRESPNDESLIEFRLTGPSLTVQELTIHTFDDQQSNILRFLSLNANNLRVGSIYTLLSESSTYDAIAQFYRSMGVLVGAVPKVRFDYKQEKAWVEFTVVQGPAVPSRHLAPPYSDACKDRVMYVAWLNSDDRVPIELVESGLALNYPFLCYSEELAQRDQRYLSNLTFISAPSVNYSGATGNRHIDYRLKSKPLKVGQISVRGFGELSSNPQTSDPTLLDKLSLRSGDYFSRLAASKSVEYLKKAFSQDGYWVEVTVQEELSGTDALRVTFSILVFPLQTVLVDGQEVK